MNQKIWLLLYSIFGFALITAGLVLDIFKNNPGGQAGGWLALGVTYGAGLMGYISIILAARESLWNYLFGIISVLLWLLYVALWSPLIWDALINLIYLGIYIYGLYYWTHPAQWQRGAKGIVKTRTLRRGEMLLCLIIAALGVALLTFIGQAVGRYANTLQASTDAVTTVLAIFGQWFVSRKILENWYIWIIVDSISIPLYISIGSYTLAMAWAAYLASVLYGYVLWKKNMDADERALKTKPLG